MKSIRLLTIGNSFSENAITHLDAIADSAAGVRFDIGHATIGGCSLEKHWNLALYTSRCPDHPTYRFAAADSASNQLSLQKALTAAPWDFVTLQQVSHKSWRRETFQPHLGFLRDMIRQKAPQARILLHQTWAYRSDSPFLPQNGLTQEVMFERIRAAYAHVAAEIGCDILPSGEAVQEARRAPGRTFSWPDPTFDYPCAQAPDLPRQDHSLAVGWHWAINTTPEGIPELRLDANHLNARGCYLAGCVWFERLTGLDARSIVFVPQEIENNTAAFLRATAHTVCSRYPLIPLPPPAA